MIEKLEPSYTNPATLTVFYDTKDIAEKLNELITIINFMQKREDE